ncbi:hypothetical protein GQ602_007407 [Ophiocordyceps camponoti-floridani]|uniref:Uncharacterized protein n=1 Tax=Ophiocordyceps camponoti-floridani TaxID=2030778 RepID=A0A8H4Q084_9HYPO|nr:hypothetical protein GQ602_007407 [Ophiocordyceps camponoti-floridani]
MMHVGRRSLATPPDQRSLPTPDVTPPGPATPERSLERCLQRPEDGTNADSLPTRSMFLPEMNMPSPTLIHFEQNESQDLLNFGRHDDIFKKYPSRNTPFSVASFETAAEVSEAMAVHMYPHQNSSLLVVDHLVKSLETADPTSVEAEQVLAVPEIRTTCANGGPGNYFEATGEALPCRRPSLVKRALGRRRNTMDCPPAGALKPTGLLARRCQARATPRNPLACRNYGT